MRLRSFWGLNISLFKWKRFTSPSKSWQKLEHWDQSTGSEPRLEEWDPPWTPAPIELCYPDSSLTKIVHPMRAPQPIAVETELITLFRSIVFWGRKFMHLDAVGQEDGCPSHDQIWKMPGHLVTEKWVRLRQRPKGSWEELDEGLLMYPIKIVLAANLLASKWAKWIPPSSPCPQIWTWHRIPNMHSETKLPKIESHKWGEAAQSRRSSLRLSPASFLKLVGIPVLSRVWFMKVQHLCFCALINCHMKEKESRENSWRLDFISETKLGWGRFQISAFLQTSLNMALGSVEKRWWNQWKNKWRGKLCVLEQWFSNHCHGCWEL